MDLLEIEGRTFAMGLFWQRREIRGLKIEARELAVQMAGGAAGRQYTLVALRPQFEEYGLAESASQELPAKVLALAGVLADQVGGKWAGHFALGADRHWVVCIIEGRILADGDVVLEEGAAAQALLAQWQSSYSGLTVERHERPAEALARLAEWARDARGPVLVPLFGSAFAAGGLGGTTLIAAVALPVVVGLGWLLWRTSRPAPMTAFAPASPASSTSQPAVHVKPGVAVRLEPELAVSPIALQTACVETYLREPLSIRGWWATEWVCRAAGVLRVTWRRAADGSFLAPPDGAELDAADPDKAIRSQALPLPLPSAGPVGVAARGPTAANLYELARVFSLQLNISWPPPLKSPPGTAIPGEPAQAPAFDVSRFELVAPADSGAPEPQLWVALAQVPGLALQSVSWRESLRSWSYEGVVYTARTSVQ